MWEQAMILLSCKEQREKTRLKKDKDGIIKELEEHMKKWWLPAHLWYKDYNDAITLAIMMTVNASPYTQFYIFCILY